MAAADPTADRPYMPGYGLLGPDQGSGLLPWSWAQERLSRSRDYWIGTVRPDGRPHTMPVWGVWDERALWFSSAAGSRKIRNLRGNPHCTINTGDAGQPLIIEGEAEIVTQRERLSRFIGLLNGKYDTELGVDFLDPEVNATVAVRPYWAFGLRHEDFAGSPTRWVFGR